MLPTAIAEAPAAQSEAYGGTQERVRVKPLKRKRPSKPPGGEVEAGDTSGAAAPGSVCIEMPSASPKCEICGTGAASLKKLTDHMTAKHNGVQLTFRCAKCGRTNANRHPIACHLPKCKGVEDTQMDETKRFRCMVCPGRFGTGSGLSQHMRHRHVTLWNQERIQQEKSAERKVEGGKRWSPYETRAIRELCKTFKDAESPDRRIAEGLGTNPTIDQVRWKRRKLAFGNVLETAEEASWDTRVAGLAKPAVCPPAVTGVEAALREHTEGTRATGPSPQDQEGTAESCIETKAEEIILLLGRTAKRVANRGPAGAKGQTKTQRGWVKRRREKRDRYKRQQMLFQRGRKKLGGLILDGTEKRECRIPVDDLTKAYTAQWEDTGPLKGLGQFQSKDKADNTYFESPITASEVLGNLKAGKKDSAAGPDGINRERLREWDAKGDKLGAIFASWQLAGRIPKAFKQGRTTLIPKSMVEEELAEIGGWRPITIGSTVLRLFSRILTGRLEKACPINPRQRGFTPTPGCAENLMILNGILYHSKAERQELAVVFIDFAKAFDTVSHGHLIHVLRERGLDNHVIGLLEDSYEGVYTTVKTREGETQPIQMKKGVKQGDPMSPLLFNLAIDPLINKLEEIGEGYNFEGRKVTTLAFADDLVLMSDSWAGMQHNINIVEAFCRLAGLRVQPKKCHGFMVRRGDAAFTINNCQEWAIGGEKMHLIDPDKTEKYLGMKVNPWLGVAKPEREGQMAEWIKRIGNSALKPSQKVHLLNVYAIPRVMYTTDHGDVGKTQLTVLDGLIKAAAKRWLRLPPSTCDGILYARNRDGGIGLVKLASVIPAMQARRLFCLSISPDPLTQAVAAHMTTQTEYEERWVLAGGERDQTPILGGKQEAPTAEDDDPDQQDPQTRGKRAEPAYKNPCCWRTGEFKGWAALPVQGDGIEEFHQDPISNSWLADPKKVGFGQRHFMTALKLRANVYPTREALARGRNKGEASCRRCDHQLETASHILGKCPGVKAARLRRHNLICGLLAEEAEKQGWAVNTELRLRTAEGMLRIPDLVFVKGRLGVVADVTVRYERNGGTLERGRREKVDRYLPIAPIVAKQFNLSRVLVYGFPMGGRGKWPTTNFELLKTLGLGKSRSSRFAALVSRRTLLYSLDILKAFGLECKAERPKESEGWTERDGEE